MDTRSGACASALVIEFIRTRTVPMFYYRDKTRVHMFYFLNYIHVYI